MHRGLLPRVFHAMEAAGLSSHGGRADGTSPSDHLVEII